MHRRLTQVLEVEEEVAIVGPHPVACTAGVVAVLTGISVLLKPSCSLNIAQTWQS